MARIIVGSYLVQFPLGGYMSWVLQWLKGLQDLGHDVFFVEKALYADSCFDPVSGTLSDDCSHGTRAVNALLERFDLHRRWCFVDRAGRYHGLGREQITSAFTSTALYIDMGAHGTWHEEAASAGLRILVDGEPGTTQMRMERARQPLVTYDAYYTVGQNIGRPESLAPTAGKAWGTVFDPVVIDLFEVTAPSPDAAFTSIMSWRAYEPVLFAGREYGQKDVEFRAFMDLPTRTAERLELAVAGKGVPRDRLRETGWILKDPHAETITFDAFRRYIRGSKGEFAVCKHVFVATHSGFFSDRSAAYLASGRPVVTQDTGIREHLPCGEGLFAVRGVEEAADAINQIASNYTVHSRAARAIAEEHLNAEKILGRLLKELAVL